MDTSTAQLILSGRGVRGWMEFQHAFPARSCFMPRSRAFSLLPHTPFAPMRGGLTFWVSGGNSISAVVMALSPFSATNDRRSSYQEGDYNTPYPSYVCPLSLVAGLACRPRAEFSDEQGLCVQRKSKRKGPPGWMDIGRCCG